MKTAARKGKQGRSEVLGKEMFWGYTWMSPEMISVGKEGKSHSMMMDRRQKRRRNQQWKLVCCEESGGWEYQNRSGKDGKVCKIEDGHRDKTEPCPRYVYGRTIITSSLSCACTMCPLHASPSQREPRREASAEDDEGGSDGGVS